MSAELKKVSREYAERVCNGEFPITYSREQVVNHTANDFTEGWNRSIEANKPDWFKAGGMAERILIDWEMKQLKSKLNDITTHYAKSVLSCDALQQENNELKNRCKILEDRIAMIMNKTSEIDLKELQSVLHNVQNVMAGYSQDDTWSDYDKQSHAELIKMQYKVEAEILNVQPIEKPMCGVGKK